MSFFDDASLAFLPSGAAGKDGKAYSIKPTDGTGDFTFSRGSNLAATRVGADGLIEKGRENLLLQSNQFDTTWLNTSTTETGGQTGYDGSSDAWKIERVGTGGYIYQDISVSGVNTISVYAKADTLNWMRLRVGSAPKNSRYFDLENGVIGSAGTAPIDAKIEAVGTDGWYRCSITTNISIDRVYFYPVPNDGDISGTSGNILIQDAQFEIGTLATDYIESGATTGKAGVLEDEPRFDYSGGATCPSLLLEPSRTNYIRHSEYINESVASWSRFFSTIITNNDAISPDGKNNATKIECPIGQNARIDAIVVGLAAGTYTYSFYAKGNVSNLDVNIYEDATGDTLSSTAIETLINDSEWSRVDITFTSTTSSTIRCIYTALTAGEYFYLWGAQLELGSYPTSYIPNHSGGSVTRGADAMDEQISGLTSLDKGTFFIDFDRGLTTATSRDISTQGFYYETLNTFAGLNQGIEIATNADGSIRAAVRTSSGFSSLYTNNTLSRFKILYKWSGTELKVFVNGSSVYSNSTKWGEITSALQYIGYNADFRKSINQVLVFTEALSDADCITLTTL